MNHAQKVRLARQMLSVQEIRDGVRLFDSKEWIRRKYAIHLRVLGKNKNYIARFLRAVEKKKETTPVQTQLPLRQSWWQRVVQWFKSLV